MGMTNILDPITILIGGVVILLIFWYIRKPKYNNLPPQAPGKTPILGHVKLLRDGKHLFENLMKYSDDLGDVISFTIGPRNAVALTSPESIKEAFVQKAEYFSDRPLWLNSRKMVAKNEGIIWNKDHWKEARRFALSSLRDFGYGKATLEERIQEEAGIVVELFQDKQGQPFAMDEIMSHATSNIICSIVFGNRFQYDDEDFQAVMKSMATVFTRGVFRNYFNFIPGLGRFMKYVPGASTAFNAMTHIQEFIRAQIQKHRDTYNPDDIRDFLDLYLQTSDNPDDTNKLTEGDAFRMIMDLFAAGTETTSTTLQWFLLYMIHYTDVQDKCRQEIEKVIGNRSVNLKDRGTLPYMEATLLEVQRISNIASVSLPHTATADVEVNGKMILKDSYVLANIYACHMNSKYWDKPEDFKPERWLDQDNKLIKHEAFIPFSIGKRVCLGESLAKSELFIFGVSFLQALKFTVADQNNPPTFDYMLGVTRCPVKFELIAEKV